MRARTGFHFVLDEQGRKKNEKVFRKGSGFSVITVLCHYQYGHRNRHW
jgi:hypothetical protein